MTILWMVVLALLLLVTTSSGIHILFFSWRKLATKQSRMFLLLVAVQLARKNKVVIYPRKRALPSTHLDSGGWFVSIDHICWTSRWSDSQWWWAWRPWKLTKLVFHVVSWRMPEDLWNQTQSKLAGWQDQKWPLTTNDADSKHPHFTACGQTFFFSLCGPTQHLIVILKSVAKESFLRVQIGTKDWMTNSKQNSIKNGCQKKQKVQCD